MSGIRWIFGPEAGPLPRVRSGKSLSYPGICIPMLSFRRWCLIAGKPGGPEPAPSSTGCLPLHT